MVNQTAAGSGGMLGAVAYAPVSDTSIATINSATLTDFDAVNLAVTFTAPASGNVLVILTGLTANDTGAARLNWGIREGGSTVGNPIDLWPTSNAAGLTFTAQFYISGVSAGSHTYKWAGSAAANSIILYGGPTFGKATMTVWAAP